MPSGLDAQKNALKALETDVTTMYPQALEGLEHRIDTAFTTAESTIKELEQKATQLTDTFVAAVKELHDAIDHGRQQGDEHVKTATSALTEAKQHVDELNKKRDADFAHVQQTLQQLETAYNKIESDSKNALDAVVQHAQPLVQGIAEGTREVEQHGTQVVQNLQQTSSSFEEGVKTMIGALHDFVQRAETEHQQHDSDHDAHSGSTQQHGSAQIAQNVQTLGNGLQLIVQALGVLGESGGAISGHFGDGVKSLLDTLEEIGKIVDAIKPVLDVVKAIE